MVFSAHSADIMVNQMGYLPSGDKYAYLLAEEPSDIQLLSVLDGRLVAKLESADAVSLPDERRVRAIDFSQVKTPGWYKLVSDNGQSVPFPIEADAYEPLNERLVHALYLQRSGMVVNDRATGMNRPQSHMQDGQIFRTDAFHKAGTHLDVVGGWYDAGDFGKYVATTTITVARLLEAYRQTPQLYSDTKQPGSDKPAIIDESIYALDWLLKMQREDGAVYRKVSGASWPAKIGPWQDNQTRFIYGVSTPETAKFAATMAFAARTIKPFDADLSRQYLSAAIHAANYLASQDGQYFDWQEGDDSGSGPYMANKFDKEASLETDVDDRLWAYAELYITTGQDKFKRAFQDNYDPQWIDIFEWKNPALMGVWHLILAEEKGAFRDQLANDLDQVASRYLQQSQQSPFRVANQRFIWGSNKMTAEAGILIAWADFAKGRLDNRTSVQSQIDYLLGANAFDMSFVTNSGTYSVRNLHHLYRIATGVSLPGYLVGGPNEMAQAGVAPKNMGMLSYIDSEKSYAVNEFAIDYNASLIGLIAVHHAYFNHY
ncbi:glycoside hydrolase family 9 protein [Photobacterium sp. ZSDE20]|uniref:Endoglucanase n=1 Tax=Photobacterium pectinilyticum TaxID=2906793 RepID=A0ABT1MZR5_9GAMM|nr:glycoside hydrolase family 9 protein [Photobacterium sp. ZSDE20]MCQ1057782.1 glycoside hydrolase family 9 protein [Photobacterium sp. ZSDE20]MDD1822306.1 glycoside hydrolase family 9 protein [Photobacterium sp. ZSDE20]